jgi:acetylornithine deacetylase/succinyl-diaminopimelate desuccinylase-like protein
MVATIWPECMATTSTPPRHNHVHGTIPPPAGLSSSWWPPDRAAPADVDDTLFPTLASILQELDSTAVPIPFLFNESPDGRLFHERGIQHDGFLPMDLPPDIDLPSLIHGPNERVPLSAVDFGAEAIYRLIQRY